MSTGPWWLKVAFVVWSLLWLGGAYGFFTAAASSDRAAVERSMPLTGLVDSGPIRIEATLDGERVFTGPVSGKRCAALTTGTGAYSSRVETDSQGKSHTVHGYASAKKRREPDVIKLTAGSDTLELATEHWRPASDQSQTKYSGQPPDGWGLTPEEIAAARQQVGSDYAGWYLDEGCLPPNQLVLVVGVAEHRRIVPPAGATFVDLFPGNQAAAVGAAQSTAKGFRIAGGIFIGLSTLPWLVLLLIVLRRRPAQSA